MKKFILLGALSVLFYSAPGHAVGIEDTYAMEEALRRKTPAAEVKEGEEILAAYLGARMTQAETVEQLSELSPAVLNAAKAAEFKKILTLKAQLKDAEAAREAARQEKLETLSKLDPAVLKALATELDAKLEALKAAMRGHA